MEINVFYCECGRSFDSLTTYEQHCKSDHGGQQHPFKCPICFKRIQHITSLKRHMAASHSDQRPFGCSLCQKKFKRNDVLTQHLFNVHKIRRGKSALFWIIWTFLGCEEVGVSFNFFFKVHNITCGVYIANASFWICFQNRIVTWRFVSWMSVRYSVMCCFLSLGASLSSRNSNTYWNDELRCPSCGKLFHNRSNMRRHMNDIHTDIRRFKCPLCDKSFKRKSVLKQHYGYVHGKADQ